MKNKQVKQMIENITIGGKRVFFLPKSVAVVDESVFMREHLSISGTVSLTADQLRGVK